MKTSISSVTLPQLDQLLVLVQAYYRFDRIMYDTVKTPASLQDLLAHPEWGSIFFIRADEVPVGYITVVYGYSVEFHGRNAWIDEFFIQPEWRGRGMGRQVIHQVEDFCQRNAVHSMSVEVYNENMDAQGFHQQVGFLLDSRIVLSKTLDTKKI